MPPRPLRRGDAIIISVALILIVLPWHILALPAMLLVAGWSITTAPVGAIKSALKKAGLKVSEIDLWEIQFGLPGLERAKQPNTKRVPPQTTNTRTTADQFFAIS